MVFALGNSRNRNRADNTRANNMNGKTPAVGGHINGVKATQLIQRLPALYNFTAHPVGTFMQAHDHIDRTTR